MRPAPAGAFTGAPGEHTRFTAAELERGFVALAFGSDLRIGAKPRGIRRFDRPVRAVIVSAGSTDRSAAMASIVEEFARAIPNLRLGTATVTQNSGAQDADVKAADIELRLIDEKNFKSALRAAFGAKIAATFVARTDPQCMTSVTSNDKGDILRAVSFIIADKGDRVFLGCAYHELLHVFGLSNHDQSNPWTALNQERRVGYLSVYDRALLTLLYDPRIQPGMTAAQARAVLPLAIQDLGIAEPAPPRRSRPLKR